MSELVSKNLHEPWLVAVWPGMGNVALAAGSYLVEALGARPLGLLRADPHFDVDRAHIKDGIVQPARLPQNKLFGWKDPAGRRDLVIFIGEAQPSSQGFVFANTLLSAAAGLGVTRVFTFAAMVTSLHPKEPSKVFRVATSADLAREVDVAAPDLVVLEDGEISGLNGAFLAAAAQSGKEAVGLLGEVPEVGVGVPYLKAALAVLVAFQRLAGIQLDLSQLEAQARKVEQGLVEMLERVTRLPQAMLPDLLSRLAKEHKEAREAQQQEGEAEAEEEGQEEADTAPRPPAPTPEAVARIEELFIEAAQDRGKALSLKAELDRQGVFPAYEDRFLDLFRRRGDPA